MVQLPARLGGLGLLSHAACSPHAPAAAAESADVVVDAIFGLEGPSECELRSQGERCKEMFSADAEAVMMTLRNSKRKCDDRIGLDGRTQVTFYNTPSISHFASPLLRSQQANVSRPQSTDLRTLRR